MIEKELKKAKRISQDNVSAFKDEFSTNKDVKMGNHFIERVVKFDEISKLRTTEQLIEYVIERSYKLISRVKYKINDPNAGVAGYDNSSKLGYLKVNKRSKPMSRNSKSSVQVRRRSSVVKAENGNNFVVSKKIPDLKRKSITKGSKGRASLSVPRRRPSNADKIAVKQSNAKSKKPTSSSKFYSRTDEKLN